MSASSQPQSHDTPAPTDVTARLLAWDAGDRAALDALVPAVYATSHAQAARALEHEVLGISPSTANRHRATSVWHGRELEDGQS